MNAQLNLSHSLYVSYSEAQALHELFLDAGDLHHIPSKRVENALIEYSGSGELLLDRLSEDHCHLLVSLLYQMD